MMFCLYIKSLVEKYLIDQLSDKKTGKRAISFNELAKMVI